MESIQTDEIFRPRFPRQHKQTLVDRYEKCHSSSCKYSRQRCAEIALFIQYLIAEHGAQASDFHVIGHSLGGQTAGYAGERVQGLGRITGKAIAQAIVPK